MFLHTDLESDLDLLLDTFGLASVLAALGDACQARAEDLADNARDAAAARSWVKAGQIVNAAGARVDELDLT